MATLALNNAKVYAAQYDVSGDLNSLALNIGAEDLDETRFGDSTRKSKGGLRTTTLALEGLFDSDGSDEPDDVFFPNIGTADVIVTASADGASAGDVAYVGRMLKAEYGWGESVGALLPFSFSGSATENFARGEILINGSAITSTATGTAQETGAVASGETLYGALHVLAASGSSPTLDVVVESDDGSGFASGTTRLTFAQQTAAGSNWQSASGAITDTWWRVSYTIGGTNPSFDFVVAIGIL